MTAVPVESRRPIPRHARPRPEKARTPLSKRIPKSVNAFLDWASPRRVPLAIYAGWFAVLTSGFFTGVSGLLLAGGIGLMLGAIVGYGFRTASEVHAREEIKRLRAEVKGLHTKAVPPVDTSDSVETVWIRRIGDER